jgi:outer membrane receptor protein involved in Fe transport
VRRNRCNPFVIAASQVALLTGGWATGQEVGDSPISEIVVTSKRYGESLASHPGNLARLSGETLDRAAPHHPNEIFNRVPGAWVVRGSGQEQQTAIRSPVLTGGGACAVFVVLENGIPIRPPGFCNVNLFSEVALELAGAVEVARGPGNALYGSNAVHGTINVLMPRPGGPVRPYAALEAGANEYRRLRGLARMGEGDDWLISGSFAHDAGVRPNSGYDFGKLHVAHERAWRGGSMHIAFSATDLSQDSAGFVYGQDAYKGYTAGAEEARGYRDVESQRLSASWLKTMGRFDVDARAYLRHSSMAFMHYETPGTPEETNGQQSAGLLLSMRHEGERLETIAGLDIDFASVNLLQSQAGPATGPSRVVETRPVGRHYDYDVTALTLAPYLQSELEIAARWTLAGGLRFEYSGYDYSNNMLAGNTRDDGSVCGFGGCLYSRPADRRDHFQNLAPKLALRHQLNRDTHLFIAAARGFRAPQTIELYRLQNGQQVSDLKTERLDSLEVGVRHTSAAGFVELTAYGMRKRNSVFRDSQGYTASGGRSHHAGAEIAVARAVGDTWRFNGNVAYGRHKYDFSLDAQQGESYVSGLDVDTAPRWLGSLEAAYAPPEKSLEVALQITTLGAYYLDSLSRYEYPGHTVANLRAGFRLNEAFRLTARVTNLGDRKTADRADFGGGDYRYLPGRGREAFLELRWMPKSR